MKWELYKVIHTFNPRYKLATEDYELPEIIQLTEDMANLFRYLGVSLEKVNNEK